MEAAYLVIAFC